MILLDADVENPTNMDLNRVGLSGAGIWPLTPIGGLVIVDPISVQLVTLL